ncbi:MAG: hypothetical protein WBM98_12745 [Maribacter sp.]|uniref:hypothetical protein n=1 Tax=Maribacter sp. TaxID=1897614 RepID=UPI003C75B745
MMRLRILHIVPILLSSWVCAQVDVRVVGQMPQELRENSGHVFYDGHLISHNDSGNEPVLYALDTVGMAISRRVTVSNAVNIDWEDISQDEDYFYVGDIGNYSGTRSDLAVYKILKEDFDQSETVTAEIINFQYEDQETFVDIGKSNWDAESLTVIDDRLWIFTKQWIDEGTVAYSLPKAAGNQVARRETAYAVDGLITGASFNEDTNDLVLVGYSNMLAPFLLRMKDVDTASIFANEVERIPLDIGFGQVEAITSITAQRYFIGTEEFQRTTPAIALDPMLYSVQFKEDKDVNEETPEEGNAPDIDSGEDRLILYGSYDSNVLYFNLDTDKAVMAQAIFDSTGKMLRFQLGNDMGENAVDVTPFESGVYYLTFYLGDRILSKAFITY